MESVSSVVKRLLNKKPFLFEAFSRGILSYGSLAAEFKPVIENSLGKEVKESAIVMALRRYAEEVKALPGRVSSFGDRLSCEILMKTNICDFNVRKTDGLLERLKGLYELINIGRGDFLNVSLGNEEISIVVSEKYEDEVSDFLDGEEILDHKRGLVSLTMLFSGDFLQTPGIIFQALRRLAWENINVYEIVSTMTELTVVIRKEDSTRGYEALQDLIESPPA
jgi:hypothetical protein